MHTQTQPAAASHTETPLIRGISLGSATALNMIDMIGVGPFITIPLIISAMGGPQAMLGPAQSGSRNTRLSFFRAWNRCGPLTPGRCICLCSGLCN